MCVFLFLFLSGLAGEAESLLSEGIEKEKGKENEEELMPDVEHSDLQPMLSLKKIRKVYSNGVVAVSGLDLDIYQGQITALLGHNGAGKVCVIVSFLSSTSRCNNEIEYHHLYADGAGSSFWW